MNYLLKIANGNINLIRTGPKNGAPVLMVHAVGTDLTLWDQQIAVLQNKYDVIAIDLPGHGLSDKFEGEPSFAKFADVISQVIEKLNVGPVHLVGISFGGMIIQTLAIQRPDLVKSLSLIGTASAFSDAGRAALKERAAFVQEKGMRAIAPLSMSRWFNPEFSERRPDVLDRINKILYQQDPLFHAALWNVISELNTHDKLKELSVPAMVIVGEVDFSTPIAAAQALAKELNTERLHIVPGSAHFTNVDSPQTVNELLIDFFDSYLQTPIYL